MITLETTSVFPDEEHHRQKRLLELELESLVVPQANAAEETGKPLINLPKLWSEPNLAERRKPMLDAVYFETKKLKSVAAGASPVYCFRPV